MEILTDSDSPVLISNAEVTEILNQRITKRKEIEAKQRRQKRGKNKFEHRDWIEENVYEYLRNTPCVNIETSRLPELKSKLTASKKQPSGKTTGFALTEAESLQILNFMPREPVEIHLMVEELHARMSEKRQEELLELIGSYNKEGPTELTSTATEPEVEEEASMQVSEENEDMMDTTANPVKQEI